MRLIANNNSESFTLNSHDKQLIELAFAEDLGSPYCDLTTRCLFPDADFFVEANIISKHHEPIILCGLPVVEYALSVLDLRCKLQSSFHDGDVVMPGQILLSISGPSSILMAERTLLNFLQRLCAVATLTSKFVGCIQHTNAKILDTRKTMPGFRHLDKYAVVCGGGVNHRMGLYDAIMIKDTHVDALGGMDFAIHALPVSDHPVIVEVRSVSELNAVMEFGLSKITRVLLDNMSCDLIRQCVDICDGRLPLESSGNVDLDNVLEIAECGVDFISVGKLTHSAGNANLSMTCSDAVLER